MDVSSSLHDFTAHRPRTGRGSGFVKKSINLRIISTIFSCSFFMYVYDKMILIILLLIINVLLFIYTREPQELIDVREKYRTLREHLKETNNQKFEMLCKEIPITAHRYTNGYIGYNVSKGMGIGICIDGKPNEIFHVLLHELAHCTVDEYSHSKEFWKNFSELKTMCVSLGIYREIPQRTEFCGKHIQDK